MPRTRTKSEFVSSVGTMFEIVKKLSDEVDGLGGSDDNLRRILSDDNVARQIAELLVSRPELDDYPFTIDRSQSLADLVADARYDGYVNPNITGENFPVEEGEAELTGVLLHPNHVIQSDEVLAEGERLGLRPATMVEGQAFAAKYPDLQRKFPILLLGAVWSNPGGRRGVGDLNGGAGRRRLDLRWFDLDWNPLYRFLFVRK